ncbi:MAG: DUF4159 domain-containing protein, partial [Phycisphaerae bacterium]
ESFPPLPLPATPLRRSERKHEPSRPALVAKAAYGPVNWSIRDGRRVGERRWLNVTDDIRNLLGWAGRRLGFRYRHFQTTLAKFSYDPAEVPALYLTGHEPLPTLSEQQQERLRRFLYDGGTIIANACCGAPEFREAFRREVARLFPRRQLAALPADHPVFSACYPIRQVRYRRGDGQSSVGPPYLEGLNIGCRVAIFFAPMDLANGWYGQAPPDNYAPGAWIVGEDARKLGANILAYILACYQYGRRRAVQKVLYQQSEPTRDELVIGQVVHDGDWDPTPDGLPGLLRALRANSTVRVQFKRGLVSLSDDELFSYPVLYMTGLREFDLDDGQIQRLRSYLLSGGLLVADAACGMRAFDRAFRRQMRRVLPDRELQVLPVDHPLYSAAFEIVRVAYSPLARQELGGADRPMLEGITVDGSLRVIYSRYSLGNGWEQIEHPYNRGYVEADALRLGVNILVYGLTH